MSWIWLPEKEYPKHQRTKFDAISDQSTDTYVVAEFKKEYAFGKEISSVEMCFSADTEVQLFCNDRLIATGPAVVGGSPLYSLPKALTGLTIVEAGYKKVKLNPTLLGLETARVEIPTPYGMILCDMKQGQTPQVTVPEGIVLEMEAWAQ
ncbi:MAG: hypothetical protein J6Q92_06695 [Oscillospiraceae bacterium]|nr:hypothetical protein [Oscillospiraceae bacterium]